MHFTKGSETMNNRQYLRFATECNLLDKRLKKADINFIFAKTTDQKVRRLNFERFKDNFTHFAKKKEVTKNEIVKEIEAVAKNMFYKDPFSFVNVKYDDNESSQVKNTTIGSDRLSSTASTSRASIRTMTDLSSRKSTQTR